MLRLLFGRFNEIIIELACDRVQPSPIVSHRLEEIARINGYCLGFGMELAAACDMRAASDHSR